MESDNIVFGRTVLLAPTNKSWHAAKIIRMHIQYEYRLYFLLLVFYFRICWRRIIDSDVRCVCVYVMMERQQQHPPTSLSLETKGSLLHVRSAVNSTDTFLVKKPILSATRTRAWLIAPTTAWRSADAGCGIVRQRIIQL